MTMSSLTRSEAAAWLLERDHFLILSHARPDGDTSGCSAALCRGLRRMGKTAYILKNEDLSGKFQPLHAGLTKDRPEKTDTVVSVDIAAPHLLTESARCVADKIQLRIDHHFSARSFTPYELVDSGAGACGDIIYDILKIWGLPLDKPTAEALYTAVSTDTGGFRYPNTNAHSFETAKACAEAGADLTSINMVNFDSFSLARLRIQGWIVENIRFRCGGKVALCVLPHSVEEELGATEEDMENISGFPRSIEGVRIAATLREDGENKIKVSVRAVPGYDASEVCGKFGGGGHKGAAGATLHMSLEEAARLVDEALPVIE